MSPDIGAVLVTGGTRGIGREIAIHFASLGADRIVVGYLRNDTAGIKQDVDKMFGIFPRLKERKDQLAGTLSGGE